MHPSNRAQSLGDIDVTRFLLGFLAGFLAFPAGVLVAVGWACARGETR